MGRLYRWMVLLLAVLVVQTLSFCAEGAKLRVLALHGLNGNAVEFCRTFSTWDKSILNLVEFNCLNGPFQEKNSQNRYIWFTSGSGRYGTRVDESIAYVLDYMRKTGPYDGILGFSMGAIMAGLVTGVRDKNMVILGRKSGYVPLRFTIIDAGGYFKGLLDEVYDPPLRTRSFHIIGNYDPMRSSGESFLSKWKNPTVAHLNIPHEYITGQNMDSNLKWSLENFFKSY